MLQTINNGETGGTVRGKLNSMFSELYNLPAGSLDKIGSMFNKTDFTSLADFTVNNVGGAIAPQGTTLLLSGGSGTQTNTIQYTKANDPFAKHTLEKWIQRVVFTTPAAFTGATFGFALGVKSSNAQQGANIAVDNMVRICLNTSELGQFYFYTGVSNQGTPGYQSNILGAVQTLTVSTDYILEVERNKSTIIATLMSLDSTVISQQQFLYNLSINPSVYLHNVGSFALYNYGGSIVVKSWVAKSGEYIAPDLLCIGDSIMHGLYSEHPNPLRYIDQVIKNYFLDVTKFNVPTYRHVVIAGTASGISDCLQQQLLINLIAGTQKIVVYINAMSNDDLNSVPVATVHANYLQLTASIKASNPNVIFIHGFPTARGVDFRTLHGAFFFANFPNDFVCDLTTPTQQGVGNFALSSTLNSGDAVHPNAGGHTTQANTLFVRLRETFNA